MADLSDRIETAAARPAAITGEGGSVTSVPIPDLIAADQYLAAKAAGTATNARGVRKSAFNFLRPGRGSFPGANR